MAENHICNSWVGKLRDEHGVENISPFKVAVNPDHVEKYSLRGAPMKKGSSRASGFEAAHGKQVYELEAFEPDQLQTIIRNAIEKVLDMSLFQAEKAKEIEDMRYALACREQVLGMLKDCRFEQ